MPTEEQMTASLLEAKDVTIAELRREVERYSHEASVQNALYVGALKGLRECEVKLNSWGGPLRKTLRGTLLGVGL